MVGDQRLISDQVSKVVSKKHFFVGSDEIGLKKRGSNLNKRSKKGVLFRSTVAAIALSVS